MLGPGVQPASLTPRPGTRSFPQPRAAGGQKHHPGAHPEVSTFSAFRDGAGFMKPVGFIPSPVSHTFPWVTITDVSYVLSPPFMSPLATVAAGRRGKMEAQAFAKRGSHLIGRAAAALKG